MKIIYKLTSRSRPDKMFACIQNIRAMALEKDPTIIISLDKNDPTLQTALDLLYPLRDMNIYTKVGFSKNKIDAFNRDVPKDGWDIIVCTSDDIKFFHGFDRQIEIDAGHAYLQTNKEIFNVRPETNVERIKSGQSSEMDFVLWYEDGAEHGKILTVPIMTRKYYERLGYIYNPIYVNLFCDEEAIYVGEKLGKIYYSAAKILEHMHPAHGKGAWDEQYRRTDSTYYVEKIVFERRKAQGFPL